ncbi:MAG: 2Fe-2S iron-sulfur cluster-binding protein [Planctomycetota bacterium]
MNKGKNGSAPEMVEWVLNGQRVTSPAGTIILEAARAHGQTVPHFCYHPGLSIAGNCRICLVETNRSPKPVISCSERIAPDLEVQTHSEMAVEAREGVMEFQLINHPLDCPVCDKAGECVLQDYSYDHGPDRSRFVENKTIRHTKDLGPTIKIWGNRCIVCTRCVRFCDEISGTSELCVVARGDRSIVDVFPGIPIDNPLAGNVVDICPVGALISNDFLYEARVWYLKRTESVCAACARGCNIHVEHLEGVVKRLMPRENLQVNEWWMCDHGRYDYRYGADDARVLQSRDKSGTPVADPARVLAGLLEEARSRKQAIAFLIDPFLTCEEMHLVKSLAEGCTEAHIGGWMPAHGQEERFPGGFVISAEKAPNRVGAQAIFGKEVFSADAESLRKALSTGEIPLAVVFAGFPHADPPSEWSAPLNSAQQRAVFNLFEGPWSDGADLVIPSATPFEKEGTYANEDGILQRVRSKDLPGHGIRTELQLLQDVQIRIGERNRMISSTGIFRELAQGAEAFHGLTHQSIPAQGALLHGFTRVPVASTGGSQ